MSFTFNAPRKLESEEANPYSNLISNAMDTYMKRQKAKMYPEQLKADIFAKELGPLAALASNPNFTGFNPEIQKMIAQRIGQHLQGGSQGNNDHNNQFGSNETTPGYADDTDIFNRLARGVKSTLSPGGQGALGKSRIAGGIENWIGKNKFSDFLGGNHVAGENASFEQAIEEGVQRLKLKGYSETAARKALERKQGENDKSWVKRVKPLFISKTNEKERAQMQDGFKEAPEGSIGLYKDGELFYIPQDKVSEALQEGFSYE